MASDALVAALEAKAKAFAILMGDFMFLTPRAPEAPDV